ncbi:2-(R)-hydroxypropyl-CoM dehydrogenase [Thalassovita autumnalis]|uniref:2-(R)-hydroxypropyl-CoM dehydrogenase n=1 Tax=Thalassovita autumnalis TaxID=2072972 RepID=A0A0N7LXI8_9RHOB|nr:SDR family oxidoreductase [Thalassovita autumnalis]CUH63207.1 2-(R)-hydroxypropyl-CoM dehydrogenase [Thalassovita autumnalis]CUH72023.1 2-(R)-hydroxypropyl-CoM dehydrogenase [Thalassovita autumnalis]
MKSIIITGASAGIGAACASRFLQAGWQVGLLARRAEALAEVAKGYDNAVVLPCDVTDAAAVKDAFEGFVAQAGRLDVLFNNAGMFGTAAPIDEIATEEWDRVRAVNLDGMIYCAHAAFGLMRRQDPQGGRIINNGSISAHAPREGSVTYTTTKHAITGMTKSLSLDGRAFGIACSQIDIGNARTELLQGIIDRDPENAPPTMDVSHVADAVMNMAVLPPEANVQFMTLMATNMPYIGRG